MPKNYILSFDSRDDLHKFLDWCSQRMPECETRLTVSSHQPTIIGRQLHDSELQTMKESPHSFRVFDDIQFDPANGEHTS